MFTFGIFTTHLPYLAFIAFYAYFLLFGIERTHEGTLQVSEKSIQIEYHVQQFEANSVITSAFYCFSDIDLMHLKKFSNATIKQKWKIHQSPHHYAQEFTLESQFCRPPPSPSVFA
ncbi:hypothetical protein [uncultured Draconibacterium sp.]|uniref:hypothetical protein n=1 Tax=uncultured Draconibacterium sp. TaxID=1573823 RepID=UPI003260BE25